MMTTTRNIGGRNHGDAEPAFAADFLSFNKGIGGVSTAFLRSVMRDQPAI